MITNYHTHTRFCDGKNSAQEMLESAIAHGIDILGFSAHAMYPFASFWHLAPRDYEAYAAEITRLKKTYAEKITVLLGYEVDYLPPISVPDRARYAASGSSGGGADFLIGSVHYAAGGAFSADGDVGEVADGIKRYFNGDGKEFVRAYYRSVRDMIQTCDFDIAGHIDVIRKRNGVLKFFDERDDWYMREIDETARTAAQKNIIVEINTGGIARAVIDDVYPSRDFLKLLKKYGVPVMINSDAHDADSICRAFDLAARRARGAGYDQTVYLVGGKRFANPL
ncbi:MAG: histidinol-phosphatase [Treponemataceae bacterium]|nr:MAG: histidinol-phosphatase [Treponemataceae bacterium]